MAHEKRVVTSTARTPRARKKGGRLPAAVVVLRNARTGRWLVKREGASRASSTHDSRDAAVAAAKRLAAGSRLVVHDDSPDAEADTLLRTLSSAEAEGGTRTTLRVPRPVDEAARSLAVEIGTSKNDALIRLAMVGARLIDRVRETEAKRQARWEAALEADAELAGEKYPSLEEMRSAVLALRDAG